MKALSCKHGGGGGVGEGERGDSREWRAESVSSATLRLGPQEGTLCFTASTGYRGLFGPLSGMALPAPGEHADSVISLSVYDKLKKHN